MDTKLEEIKLERKQCKPCEGDIDALNHEQASHYLQQIAGWKLDKDGTYISRNLKFRDFSGTMMFVNAMAYIAEQQGHHPDFSTGYNYCDIRYTTHAISGLSDNDFICAAKINNLLEP
jgi:4a-hydroxytetrahydrobiopterin dehydratase